MLSIEYKYSLANILNRANKKALIITSEEHLQLVNFLANGLNYQSNPNIQFMKLDEEIKNEKGKLYEKLNKIEKMKDFFEEYEDSWIIKDGQVQFTNVNRMIEYYNLFNQIID